MVKQVGVWVISHSGKEEVFVKAVAVAFSADSPDAASLFRRGPFACLWPGNSWKECQFGGARFRRRLSLGSELIGGESGHTHIRGLVRII